MGGISLPYQGSFAAQSSRIVPNQIANLNLWYDAATASATNFNPVPADGGAVTS